MGRLAVILLGLAACGRMGFEDEPIDDDMVSSTGAKITIQNAGAGVVVGPNGFMCTDPNCTLEVEKGTPVTLRGLAPDGSWFAGWTNLCGGNFDCNFSTDVDATIYADFAPTPNRAFVTSTTVADGAFGGIAVADAECAARASAAGMSGTFIAYLSDSVTNAASRIATSRGWVRTDGAPYADAPTAFTDGSILFPPRLDEYGTDLGNVDVYTGTNSGATTTASLCTDWSSNMAVDNGGMSRTQYARSSVSASNRACTTVGHFMCMEIGRVSPVHIRPDTGMRAFVTTASWTPGGGRASADALCASEASSVGMTGTYLAAIATTTETIESRFVPGAIYRRMDGMRLLRGPGLFSADWLDVPAELDKAGQFKNADIWTGTTRLNVLASAAQNCNDWTDGTIAASGAMQYTTHTDMSTPGKTETCDSTAPLLCLER